MNNEHLLYSYNPNNGLVTDNTTYAVYKVGKEYGFNDGIYTFTIYKKKDGTYSVYKRKKYDYFESTGVTKSKVIAKIRKLNMYSLCLVDEFLFKLDTYANNNINCNNNVANDDKDDIDDNDNKSNDDNNNNNDHCQNQNNIIIDNINNS